MCAFWQEAVLIDLSIWNIIIAQYIKYDLHKVWNNKLLKQKEEFLQ